MGAVYRGYDTRLQRTVALKVLPPERFADLDRKRRLHARGPRRVGPEPPQHRHDLRNRLGRERGFHRHGIRGRQEARRGDSAQGPAGFTAPALRRPGRGCFGQGARRRGLAPGPQAIQHHGHTGGPHQASRLRTGQGAATGGYAARRSRHRDGGTDRGRSRGGDGSLYVARAGGRPQARRAVGRVQLRLGSLRDGHRTDAVHRRLPAGAVELHRKPGATATRRNRAVRGGTGKPHSALPAQGTIAPLSDNRRTESGVGGSGSSARSSYRVAGSSRRRLCRGAAGQAESPAPGLDCGGPGRGAGWSCPLPDQPDRPGNRLGCRSALRQCRRRPEHRSTSATASQST